ncbi:MAG: Methylmalonyl-CoA mutase [Ktedonobacterales bacterium]|jgi:methylmalonyl-CoA mutase N-terminal domain/subunit|nr:MAG: Methylmalonyl-CoA mutase [Ktedonobacterales bacterium]
MLDQKSPATGAAEANGTVTSPPEQGDGALYAADAVAKVAEAQRQWEATSVAQSTKRMPERTADFTTQSGMPIKRLYTPEDVAGLDYARDLNFPGEYPYTRGVQPTMYRGKPWTMRMFAGFGTAEETNERFHYLLNQGQMGLSVAFDMATLYGYDHDHPMALGEFGKCGVAVSSLADMEILFQGIPLDKVTTSMTINSPAPVIWAMYIAAAEKQGVPMEKLGGTLQNDILKEYIAQKEFLFPPEPSMRLVVDTIEFGTRHMPRWNTVSISGYHIREAGATAVQELAFTLADGLAYVDATLERGLKIDEFAPRLSFFFDVHNDFFEEIAKFRAARRIWAREMREHYDAQDQRSWMLRTHAQTAGVSLTAQQAEINVARVAIQALAAVLGGTNSLHTNSLDEALALPTEKAALIALRTQQVIAHESGITNTVDPLAGSFFIEALTNETERQATAYIQQIRELGGVLECIRNGFFQKEIAEASYRLQQEVEAGERIIVGVNDYVMDEQTPVPTLYVDPAKERIHLERLTRVRSERDNERVGMTLAALEAAARGTESTMPFILDAVRAYASLGEIMGVFRKVFGDYTEAVVY